MKLYGIKQFLLHVQKERNYVNMIMQKGIFLVAIAFLVPISFHSSGGKKKELLLELKLYKEYYVLCILQSCDEISLLILPYFSLQNKVNDALMVLTVILH